MEIEGPVSAFVAILFAAIILAPVTAGLSQIAIRLAQIESGNFLRSLIGAVPVNIVAILFLVTSSVVIYFDPRGGAHWGRYFVVFGLPAGLVVLLLNLWLLRLADGRHASRSSAILATALHATLGLAVIAFAVMVFIRQL